MINYISGDKISTHHYYTLTVFYFSLFVSICLSAPPPHIPPKNKKLVITVDFLPWRGSPPGLHPELPWVCGLRMVVPEDALSSHVELPQPRCLGRVAAPARPAGAQDHQDAEARAEWEHGSCSAAPCHYQQCSVLCPRCAL